MKLTSAILLTAAMILGLSGCSGETDLYKTVPADVVSVTRVNFSQLAEKAGFTKNGDSYVAPDYLRGASGSKTDEIDKLLKLTGCIDLDAALAVNVTADYGFFTFAITDYSDFCTVLEDNGLSVSETGGYRTAVTGGYSLLFNKRQGWLLAGSDTGKAVSEVDKILKNAGEMSVKKLEGVCDFLKMGDDSFRVAFSSEAFISGTDSPEELTAPWWTVSANVEDRQISFEASHMKADGDPIPFEGLQPVNSALLGYVGKDATLVALAGITPDFDWKSAAKLIDNYGDLQTRGFIGVVLPYLRAIDGTALISVGVDPSAVTGSSDFTDSFSFTAMLHMPQQTINEALGNGASMLRSNGVPFTYTEDNLLHVDAYGLRLFAGNVDGYLGVSNRLFSPNHDNALAKDFVGKNGGLYLNINSLRDYAPVAPSWGIRLVVAVEDNCLKGSLKLNNSNDSILPTIIKAAI